MSATEPATVEEALAYARNYWQHGNEPVTQRVLTILAQLVGEPVYAVTVEGQDPASAGHLIDGPHAAILQASRQTAVTDGTLSYVAVVQHRSAWRQVDEDTLDDGLSALYDAALPATGEGAWIRDAIDARRRGETHE